MIPSNPFAWGTQAHRLYERLTYGPICNLDIVRELSILGYNKLICRIRKSLAGTGVTVKARPVNYRGTLVEYRLGLVDDGERSNDSTNPLPGLSEDGVALTAGIDVQKTGVEFTVRRTSWQN